MITPNFISRRSQFELGKSSNAISQSFERLSTGLRINGASDDVAGLSISTRMGSQVEGLQQSIRNANDSISLFQTAEGALGEIENMLQRARELSVQASNAVLNTADRQSIQSEINQIKDEINQVTKTTSFNQNKIFSGEHVERTFQLGANVGETNSVHINKIDTDSLGRQARYTSLSGVTTVESLTNGGNNNVRISLKERDANGDLQFVTLSDSNNASDTLSKYSSKNLGVAEGTSAISKAAAINSVSEFTGVRAIVGETRTDNQDVANFLFAAQDFGNTGSVQATTLTSTTFMEINGVKIADFSVEDHDATGTLLLNINSEHERTGVIAELNASGELVLVAKDGRDISIAYSGDNDGADLEASLGLLAGSGGFFAYGGELTLQSDKSFEIRLDANSANLALGGALSHDLNASGTFVKGTNQENTIESLDLTSTTTATRSIEVIDFALEQISSERAKFGALQNRTESAINNLEQTSENLSAATSRIRDADFAHETALLASNQIQQQAASSMLAQVSRSGQIVLSLLQ